MFIGLSRRLLTVLQLTRMALVFTAIADSQAALMLATAVRLRPGESMWHALAAAQVVAVLAMSVGLYGFGMSLNDIIDRRRDRQIAAHRPIPSGRVGVVTAHVICFGLGAIAVFGGITFHLLGGSKLAITLVLLTLGSIIFYDLAGKYLVGPGLVALGLVRFFHAMVPALTSASPHLPVAWHPIWLLTHVAVLSTVCYAWEEKRPPLNRWHWCGVLGAVALIDIATLLGVAHGSSRHGSVALDLQWGLLLPLAASAAFIVVAARIRRTSATSRDAGQKTMLFGLLWLIVYDACFVGIYADWLGAMVVFLLLPAAYLSVQLMRWWSKLMAASQKPQFKRAGT